MITMDGIKFIEEKEASARFGYSSSWFRQKRWKKEGPPYFRMNTKGRVLYCLEELDKWFRDNLRKEE